MLVILRTPIDLMVVLDKSGSMGYSFDGTNLSAMSPNRRWDGLVTSVGVMAASIGTPVPNDLIGLRYFESGVTLPAAPFNLGLVSMPANLSLLNGEVSGKGPGSNTALGDGILAGKTLLLAESINTTKEMIVFSDGMQNSGDQVQETGPNAYKKTTSGVDLSGSGIIINTICLGSSGDNPTLMENIALNNGGGEYFNSQVNDDGTIIQGFFQTAIQNILSGNTPEYVDVRAGQFKADSGKALQLQESFTVNKSVNSVLIVLAADDRLKPVITSVKKDGQELIQYASSSNGPGYRTLAVKFPMTYLPAVKPDGQWVITATGGGAATTPGISVNAGGGTPSLKYNISLTVDDHLNHLQYSLNRNLKVGDTLHPAISINRLATPLGTATVQAIVLKPGDDINDLIARSNVQYTSPSGDSSTPDVGKLSELMKDSAFLAKIKAANKLVTLTYDPGAQTYTGNYPELDVAGVYRVIYNITNSDTNGVMNRYYLKSFNVRFKDVDLGASNVSVVIDSLTHNAIIIFRPISSTGKYIGSGWGSSIGLQAQTAGLKIDRIEDLGDGTYKLHLNGPLAGDGVLTIANDTVYTGALGDITKGNSGGGSVFGHWWFWALLILILLLIIWASRKKQP
jgi:hypothetical protein